MPNPARGDGDGGQPALIRCLAVAGVFLIALATRWPACGESFWVDELHTAWCVSGSLDQVHERALIGNQQPVYFQALYLWWRCLPQRVISFYGAEAALRLTSVLLTSLSAAWLTWIVSKGDRQQDLVGGIAAGMALSLESDSIFFGTELRPYAAIMFLTTAVLATAWNWRAPADRQGRGYLERIAVHALVMLAAAVHVTALTVLGPLLVVMIVGDVWRHRCDHGMRRMVLWTHGLCIAIWIAAIVWWCSQHTVLWQSRGAWSSFATAKSWTDIWQFWPWGPLVLLPVLTWVGVRIDDTRRIAETIPGGADRRPPREVLASDRAIWAMALLSVVVTSTLMCYLLSRYGGVPLWHGRYLVAALPLLCAAMGWFIGEACRSGRWSSMSIPLVCLSLLVVTQGTLSPWWRGEPRLVHRGENWKSAIALVRNTAEPGDRVWIDAGLIEQNSTPTVVSDPRLEEYLRYVTAGPYFLAAELRVAGMGRGAIAAWLASERPAAKPAATDYLITRRASAQLSSLPPNVMARRFGSVTVLIRQ